MKKLIFTALIAVSFCFSASSQTENVNNSKAVRNFEANFRDVSSVQWVSKENFTKASFIREGHNFEAFYNPFGDFIGTTSYVDPEDLPLFVKTVLNKKYSNYKVQDAFELITDDNSTWFITAENDINSVVLKVENGTTSVYSKVPKKVTSQALNSTAGL